MVAITQGFTPNFPPMNQWDVADITDMLLAFSAWVDQKFMRDVFNEDMLSWNVSKMTKIDQMFFIMLPL